MSSRSRNVNLNKEPFEGGYVRHWKRQWVSYGDKSQDDKGAWTLKLIKWVRTDVRVTSRPARQPHITPVTDLSLVPGARLNSDTAAPAAATATPAAAPVSAEANGVDAAMAAAMAAAGQQPDVAAMLATMQQQDATGTYVTDMTMAATTEQQALLWQQQQQLWQAYAGSAQQAAASVTVAAATSEGGGQMPRVGSLNALSLEVPSASQQEATPAGGAAAAGAAQLSYMLPSPSVMTGGPLGYSLLSGSQLQLQTTGSDFAAYAAGAPSVGGAGTTSGFTAGTERTDSDALGRLPHAGGAAASEYTDSMDVDVDTAGASQGGASQQFTGRGVVVAGSMDTAGDMEDLDSDEGGGEEGEGDDEGDEEDLEDDQDDDGFADDGIGGVGDMP